MPAKKPRPKNEKPQKERFIDAAKKLETDTSGASFEKAIEKILTQKSKK